MLKIDPPPSRLYLFRHAKSGWAEPGQHDFDRTLDDQGYAEAELVCDRAADRNYRPDMVISSTATRCRQTCDAVKRAFRDLPDPLYVDELYNGSLTTYLALASGQRLSRSVMIIGHNPVIEELLLALVGNDQMTASIGAGFPTAGFAVVDYSGSADGSPIEWTLTDFLRP
ncbi:MAG: histidine phosphatase family protein [Neorhizobium sp.]|jgi:phosphohistidine phosphatase|nr:histidine phosphatase family protein [Neorhizobium sp.]